MSGRTICKKCANMRFVLMVLIIFSFHSTLSSLDGLVNDVVFDFENGTFSGLSTNCANGYYLSQDIRKIRTLNVTLPTKGLYAYYVANGYGCLVTEFLYLGDQTILEVEYYVIGDLAPIKIQVMVQEKQWHFKKKVLAPESANKWNVLQTTVNTTRANLKYKASMNIYNFNNLNTPTKS